MGDTYWYAYDGTVSGPYFETKAEAAEACDDGEKPRPIDEGSLPEDRVLRDDDAEDCDDGEGDGDLPDDHGELKALARERGVADEANLRSKESIRDALRDA